ncbi:Phosphate-selective porin O and P [Aquisphaera giovannonii]|uniref:Phosphate-selective porin O and P n=1 Tax=Aquisphaera giovannonii TaxID=406548 RepID=A0A5B9WE52_9BACT|nr:porin [Aquisphaera giovannonii]QEH38743.1 Phosphate-selective porin O and P [Aquisphaera giovannonii]
MHTPLVTPGRSRRRSWPAVPGLLGVLCGVAMAARAAAQDSPPAPPALPAGANLTVPSNAELAEELRRLRSEVAETRALRQELESLRGQIQSMNAAAAGSAARASDFNARGGAGTGGESLNFRNGSPADAGGREAAGTPGRYQSGTFGGDSDAEVQRYGLKGRYKYNDKATGPLGGGGYFHLGTEDDEFSLNITNQITVDGTFVDRTGLPTTEKGFNIPFARTFFYGNITKDFSYQVGTQGFLGTFNLLDLFMAWHINKYVTMRAGKGLTPPVYEYYAFTPALEPVITNSPLYQVAAKRPVGIMFNGMLWKERIQWWSGVTNSGTSLFGDLDRNVDYNGAVDLTPFRGEGWEDTVWEGLGGGVGFSAGDQQYLLQQQGVSISNNGESTTNPAFSTVLGVPFHSYDANVSADGMQSIFAPHIYWYGRFSVLAEYVNFSRELRDPTTVGRSTQRAYYVNLSYWLTGERDFRGNGFQGYSTVIPRRPFSPSNKEWGPGAWQLAAQWSEFNAGTGDFRRGFVDPATNASLMQNFMGGVNWWPNRYTRFSFDYVWTHFNSSIPLSGRSPVDGYQTFWMRFAMFF